MPQAKPVPGASAPAAAKRRCQLPASGLPARRTRIARLARARHAVSVEELSPQFCARINGRADHASIELGTGENTNIRLITWPEILARETTPLATREAASPATIRVSYSLRGEARSDDITADARPFGLERTIDGARSYLFFPGIEADCASEPIDASDAARSSIAKKFAAYTRHCRTRPAPLPFRLPQFLCPLHHHQPARLRSMMELLNRSTKGRGSKILLFKIFPSFTSAEKPPPASGHVLTEPWQRVGFPPLCLDR